MRTQGIIGSVMMALGGMCPLMRIPIIGNWNYFDIDQRLAIAFYVMAGIALLSSFTKKAALIRFAGWGAILVVLVTLAGIYFKAHDSFSFLHFKKLVSFAAGMVKYKWGWYVIAAGAFILITVKKTKIIAVAAVNEGVVSEGIVSKRVVSKNDTASKNKNNPVGESNAVDLKNTVIEKNGINGATVNQENAINKDNPLNEGDQSGIHLSD